MVCQIKMQAHSELIIFKMEKDEHDIPIGGYGYWKREEDLIDNDKFIPKEVVTEKVEETKGVIGSAWNSAGTWEEKHYVKKQIEEYFNEKIKEQKFSGFTLSSVKGYTGDVRKLFLFHRPTHFSLGKKPSLCTTASLQ